MSKVIADTYRLHVALTSAISQILRPILPQSVLCFHQGRCGSSVLGSLLKQNPGIQAYGEVLNRYHGQGFLPAKAIHILRHYQLRAFPNPAYLEIKFMDCQHMMLVKSPLATFVDALSRSGIDRFVVLNRRNYLAKVISTAVALERGGKFHFGTDEDVPETSIYLDINAVRIQGKTAPLLELFQYMDDQYEQLCSALSGRDALHLWYEDDILADPRRAYRMICNWSGIKATEVAVRLRKTSQGKLSRQIANWDQVAFHLAGTRYSWMLSA